MGGWLREKEPLGEVGGCLQAYGGWGFRVGPHQGEELGIIGEVAVEIFLGTRQCLAIRHSQQVWEGA